MQRIDRPACLIAADRIASCFLALDEGVVAGLAHRFNVTQVEEQGEVTLMRLLVVGDSSPRVMPVAFQDDAAAALAGIEVSE